MPLAAKSYLMQKFIQRSIGHVLCDDTEELRFVAHTEDLNNVVETGLVKHLSLLQ